MTRVAPESWPFGRLFRVMATISTVYIPYYPAGLECASRGIGEGYEGRKQLERILTVTGRRLCGFKLDNLTLFISVRAQC